MRRVSKRLAATEFLPFIDAVVREDGLRFGDGKAVLERIAGMAATPMPPHRLHGKRIEAMFGHVVAALDSARLIKEEDAGEAFVATQTPEVSVPDYRIVLNDGSSVLVEVKNHHGKAATDLFRAKASYVEKLRAYGQLDGSPVMLAVFWSRWNFWTLHEPEDLRKRDEWLTLEFPDAMKRNRMAAVGDFAPGVPAPITARIVSEPQQLEEGQSDISFRSTGLEFYCQGNRLDTKEEKKLAFFIMLFGRWPQREQPLIGKDLVFTGMEYVAEPTRSPGEPPSLQHFSMLDPASSMLSRAYSHRTTSRTGDIQRLRPLHEPEPVSSAFPRNYASERMPLWRFTLEPNLDDHVETDERA